METTETLRRDRRLVRPHDGRWLGGVSAGLGHYFDLNPTIYRVAFVALALAGGTGLLLYAAAWVVIPDEGADDSAAVTMLRRQGAHPARAIGLALIAFVAILVLGEAHLWPDPGNVWLAAAIAGAGLVWWHASGRATALPGGDPAVARRLAVRARRHGRRARRRRRPRRLHRPRGRRRARHRPPHDRGARGDARRPRPSLRRVRRPHEPSDDDRVARHVVRARDGQPHAEPRGSAAPDGR